MVPYHRYVRYLKWLTLALFAYVGVVFTVQIDWSEVAVRTVMPQLALTGATATMVVAVFGTTISPYLFFWQASEEVEDDEADPTTEPLLENPEQAPAQLSRIRWDTYFGMAFVQSDRLLHHPDDGRHPARRRQDRHSDLGATPPRRCGRSPATSPSCCSAWASSAPACSPCRSWPARRPMRSASRAAGRSGSSTSRGEAVGFYSVIGLATLLGVVVDYSPLDPIKALFWSAVLNGVISVPIMAAMMVVVSRRHEMGPFVATLGQRVFGWVATALMAATVVAMFILS